MLLHHKVGLSPIGDTEHTANYIDTTVRGVLVQYNGESVMSLFYQWLQCLLLCIIFVGMVNQTIIITCFPSCRRESNLS